MKMLIDATHAEETRVVVVDGTKVEEFDFETLNRRQISGNIYLAKVTRVEPSLQAAFVDYGGNRHGFLAFAEIHPDYYQIPAADREALLAEERAQAEEAEAEEASRNRSKRPVAEVVTSDDDRSGVETAQDGDDEVSDQGDDNIESVADEDVTEEVRAPRRPRARRYKIQEVVKVRQIMLVQVVKEERGNKGAALTTYLSLPGRYCVLMPNTARGGGISRKITNAADRKKLKDIAAEFDVPRGAGLIIRTAGSQRTRTEIRRDYEYLLRLWEQIRELTFKSIAPAAIYEEGDIIKRNIRDLYSKEIDEILVEGERGYRVARDFMKMIMPSHARNVKHYQDQMPLFARFQVESYLSGMFNPTVQLKSGGYIVIGVTEALVAIDVNSGRATKEGSIEETALKTNLEAADEVARQLRLRDLAGLIVIDFIDMDERKNNAAVEKRIKDKLKSDRARIQIGRISGFGLMEMSRQRLRPGMLESTTQPCPHCHGTGLIRSDDSLALTILRAIEEEGTRKRSREVLVRAPIAVANFLMNAKREHVAGIEARYGMSVRVEADPTLVSPDFALEKFKTATRVVPEAGPAPVSLTAELMAQIDDEDERSSLDEVEEAEEVEGIETTTAARSDETDDETGEGKSRKRRRRRRRASDRPRDDANGQDADAGQDDADQHDTAEPRSSQPQGGSASGGSRSSTSRNRSSASGNHATGGAPALPEAVDLTGADGDETRAEALPDSAPQRGVQGRNGNRNADQDAGQDAGQDADQDADQDKGQDAVRPEARPEARSEAQSKAETEAAPVAEARPQAQAGDVAPVAELAVLDGLAEPVTEPVTEAEAAASPAAEAGAEAPVTPAETPTDPEANPETGAKAPDDAPATEQGQEAEPATVGAETSPSQAANQNRVASDQAEGPKRRGWWSAG